MLEMPKSSSGIIIIGINITEYGVISTYWCLFVNMKYTSRAYENVHRYVQM